MATKSSRRLPQVISLPLCVVSLMFFLGAAAPEHGCGDAIDQPGPGADLGGAVGAQWSVAYQDTIKVTVKNAGGIVSTQDVSWAAGGTFDVGGIQVSLADLCSRPDVACPNEVFPHQVTMTQPGSQLHMLYVTFNKEGPLGNLTQTKLAGVVDRDDFSIALGIKGAVAGPCGLLAVSYAAGDNIHDNGQPPFATSLDGDIVTAYSGGCIVPTATGAVAAGLTVEIRVPFSAQRL